MRNELKICVCVHADVSECQVNRVFIKIVAHVITIQACMS